MFYEVLSCYSGLQTPVGACMSLWNHTPISGVACCRENWCNISYNWVERPSFTFGCVKHF
jgi:hypothetical protein